MAAPRRVSARGCDSFSESHSGRSDRRRNHPGQISMPGSGVGGIPSSLLAALSAAPMISPPWSTGWRGYNAGRIWPAGGDSLAAGMRATSPQGIVAATRPISPMLTRPRSERTSSQPAFALTGSVAQRQSSALQGPSPWRRVRPPPPSPHHTTWWRVVFCSVFSPQLTTCAKYCILCGLPGAEYASSHGRDR